MTSYWTGPEFQGVTDDVDFPPLTSSPSFPPDVLEDETSFPQLRYVSGPSAEVKCFLLINFELMFLLFFFHVNNFVKSHFHGLSFTFKVL